jgi:uncharacterized membrane protein HdeD (DUF308 family)
MESQVRNNSGWAIALGITMIILGIIAIAAPIFTSFAAEQILGWLFVIGAVVQAFYAIRSDRQNLPVWIKLLLSILYLAVGILLLANPLAGVVSLTFIVGVFFFAEGVYRISVAFRKSHPRWLWMVINGFLMIVLGILIWSQWPFNAAWILGMLVGFGLLFNGIGMLILGATD